MTPTNQNGSDRHEIETLLPWYVAQTLDPQDMRRVEAALAGDQALSKQLALLREEQRAAVEINENLGAPSPGALDRLMAAVEAETPRRPQASAAANGLWQKLSSMFEAPLGAAAGWTAAAAAVIIVVQAVALGTLMSGRQGTPATYQTASGGGEQTVSTGTFALVRFADDVTAGEISAHLGDIDATIVDGPKPGGVYKIRLSDVELNETDTARAIKTLRADGRVVTFVTIAK